MKANTTWNPEAEKDKIVALCIFMIMLYTNVFAEKVSIDDDKKNEVKYIGGELESPFKPSLPMKKQIGKETSQKDEGFLDKLDVQGIVWGGESAQAIINNAVVRVGDTIEGAEVMLIQKDRIELSYEGETFILISQAQHKAD